MEQTRIPNSELLSYIAKSFRVSNNDIERIIASFHSEMSKGLAGNQSSLAMIPTFVEMPAGNETGKFIALDLGGTNFRILEVVLNGKGKVHVTGESKFHLNKKDITGTGKQLFDFITNSIKHFMHTNKISKNEKRNLGFTFSFPIEQTNIAQGILVNWNKGFSASDVVGKNVVNLLNSSLKRKRINNIKIAALLNDTVGTLATKSYNDSNCDLGVILGTGTNACYPEEISKIGKWRRLKTSSGKMIINIEWGNFNKLHRTIYDEKLDKATENAKRQRLEKMVSGLYLGEIARLIFSDLVKRKMLLKGNVFASLTKPGTFKTEYISNIENDNSKQLTKIKELLIKLGIKNSTYKDRMLIKKICKMIIIRSAYISSAAMAAVILWMDPKLKENHTIAIDGSLFEKCPGYRKHIETVLRKVFGTKAKKIKLALAKDGSGKGAAIVAAIASRI